MNKNDEMILVVPRTKLMPKEHLEEYQGYLTEDKIDIKLEDIEVQRRGDMEENPEYKQLITYAIVKEKATNKVLKYTRLNGSGESRLVAKTSIGVGGHTNVITNTEDDEKPTVEGVMLENCLRELTEELKINSGISLKSLGFINDDGNEVGEVHLGVVYLIEVESAQSVQALETDTLEITFEDVSDIEKDEKLEAWSKLLLESKEIKDKLK